MSTTNSSPSHPADDALKRALSVARGLPRQPSPDQVRAWDAEVQLAVADLCDAVPHGRATRAALELSVLVLEALGRLSESPPFPQAIKDTVVMSGSEEAVRTPAEVHRYRTVLEVAIGRVGERMVAGPTEDTSEALKNVLNEFEHRGAREVAELLGIQAPAVRRWRRGQAARVQSVRLLVVCELVEELEFARNESRLSKWLWFWTAAPEFEGRRPVDLLNDDPAKWRDPLVLHARMAPAAMRG